MLRVNLPATVKYESRYPNDNEWDIKSMTCVLQADATSVNRPAGGGSNEGPDVPSYLQMSKPVVFHVRTQ